MKQNRGSSVDPHKQSTDLSQRHKGNTVEGKKQSFQQRLQLDIDIQKMNLDTDLTLFTKNDYRLKFKMQNYKILKR